MAENGNGALTVTIDPGAELPSRYLGSDEDGPHYGSMTLYDAIAETAAAKLLKLVEKDLRESLGERITAKVDELVEAEVPALFREALDGELTVTNDWGEKKASGTLREIIVKQMQGQLTVGNRNSYGSRTVLSEVIREEIDHTLKRDLGAAVAGAKADLVKKLQVEAGAVMADTIKNAIKGN